ncbi:TadE/TadG family type IV pilus assembly protein [Sphingomonas radiodurans]|uniref:TadE/TadG family type IV pilus assembly protein n=1 Tax=Sphingomonas radiodurans TaxID=2890321 RepID=UPI001E2E8FA8|nr:TadE/TadG family type IV pilus assembly protein [Sphingomonas radiodurans]WBH16021.1 pilus assembly protein TadG-related protein [Sphingomonas radiodurans]
MRAGTTIITTFLGRLRRDVRGNTLAVMAIALIPVSALAGSAVDMARLYVVKVRLQQACDAGVLAGRKFMTDTNSSALDTTAVSRATTFFNNNFTNGWMRTNTVSFTPTKTADNQVAGAASVVVPMTVMKMFKTPDVTLNVTCEARYDVADTDVMFVLDTTGSMACPPEMSNADCTSYVNGKSTAYTRPTSDTNAVSGYLGSTGYAVTESSGAGGSRIGALRQAVKDFYSTMAANADSSTHIRYGFVTYTSTVNAGKAIYSVSPSYLVGGSSGDKWFYQTRKVRDDYTSATGAWTDLSPTRTQTQCNALTTTRDPTTAKTYQSNGTASQTEYRWTTSGTDRCQYRVNTLSPQWIYGRYEQDVSSFITGAAVTDPTKVTGETTKWDGCIEERDTEAGVTSFTAASKDLDPDLIPTSDISTRWKPMWASVIYGRNRTCNWWGTCSFGGTGEGITNGDDANAAPPWATESNFRNGFITCGKPVKRLSEMTAAQVNAYVDATDFKAVGGTYHDTGMIWGVRMLSPNGIFAADTAPWAGRAQPNRVIVFLTDGAMAPSQTIYGLYGLEQFDRRISGGTFSSLTDYHNARFLEACNKARTIGIDVWTVAIGMDTTTELTSCASNIGQALDTTSGTGLSDTFKRIAKQVAMLRVSK